MKVDAVSGAMRTAPSAGGIYPLRFFLVCGEVEGLPPGVYLYEPSSHALKGVSSGDRGEELARAVLGQGLVAEAPASLVFSADYEAVEARYGERGARYAHLDAGCGISPPASCTSMDGTGWTGLSTGYNCRNLLAVEWVLPDGNVLRLGTAGSGLGWFCGGGLGPSLRGVMHGLFGARSGLGLFTKAAVKPYPCSGEPFPDIEGTTDDLRVAVPPNFRIYLCIFPSFEAYADFAYRMAGAEIGFMLCKNSISLILSTYMPRLFKKLAGKENLKAALNAAEHMLQFMIAAASPGELEHRRGSSRRLLRGVGACLWTWRRRRASAGPSGGGWSGEPCRPVLPHGRDDGDLLRDLRRLRQLREPVPRGSRAQEALHRAGEALRRPGGQRLGRRLRGHRALRALGGFAS
ncbi:MAG: nitroreductase family protein [Actinomycetota bacterium]